MENLSATQIENSSYDQKDFLPKSDIPNEFSVIPEEMSSPGKFKNVAVAPWMFFHAPAQNAFNALNLYVGFQISKQ